ncbi:hypothetical protein [Arthrobacter caoxuetaonis]|uniref:Uncharacterized protein n=1 Tax=Arthrobacter caoxuetaonis TaxID=2886935 RepID=A0A9X1SCN0_9MICC|nr:hypothetical protein [Arthrobacter caoxuetaonis]MCC3283212.1 hypothetical protein [Arthrobacter caoxuetaonis]MCC3298333.1 hypothetical protein [Arthrobacter caoxuetaonis]USQ57650.1 hypothetical protein NF551_01945 [Arthrobacter caoxuetaonis]
MEFVVIVLFVAAIVLVNFLVGRAQRRRAARPAEPKQAGQATPKAGTSKAATSIPGGRAPAGTSLETAREAVSRLDEKGHQQVYAAIAQGQPIRAIQLYAQLTGSGLRAASTAVASMASHPLPYVKPKAAPAAPEEAAAPETTLSNTATEESPDLAGAAPGQAKPAAAGKPAKAPGDGKSADSADKDAKAKDAQALPDEAEISKWAQNLRPEDF